MPARRRPGEPAGVAFTSPDDGGVYNAPQKVAYTVTGAAGAAVEAKDETGQTLANGATIEAEGLHTITATVGQGGQAARKRLNFLIDRTPPKVEASWQPLSASSVTLDVKASDELTEVTEAHYRVDDGPWTPLNEASETSVGLTLKPRDDRGAGAGHAHDHLLRRRLGRQQEPRAGGRRRRSPRRTSPSRSTTRRRRSSR